MGESGLFQKSSSFFSFPEIPKSQHKTFTFISCDIFNNSLMWGIFPETWKMAVIVPILKTGKRSHILDSRPIYLLPSFSKLLKRVIHHFLFLKFPDIAIPYQHDNKFAVDLSGRWPATNLVTFMFTATQAVCNKGQLDVIYVDLSKVFDVINHTILLAKLSAYGVCGSVLDWIKKDLKIESQTSRLTI